MLRHHVLRQAAAQMTIERGQVDRGARRGREVGHQAHVARLVFARDDHAARHARRLVAARLDLAELDAVAAHLDLEVEAAQVFQEAVVAPAAAVAAAVDQRVDAVDGGRHEALGRELGPVEVAQRHAHAADADLARHADRAGLQVAVEDPDAGVRHRAADRDAARRDDRALHAPDGRPHGGFRRSVEVPELARAVHQLERQIRGHRLGADPGAEAARARPLCIEQQPPHAGRGLQDGDGFRLEQRAQPVAVHRDLALHDHDLGARRQRQHHLGHRHVEGQRGQRGHAVARTDAGLALHRLHQVRHRAVRHAHALGLAGRAGGVDHVGRVLALRILGAGRERRGRFVLPCCVEVEQQHAVGRIFAPHLRRCRDRGGGQQQTELRVFGVIVQASLREGGVERHVGGAALEHRKQGNEHVEAAVQAQADAFAAPHAARTQRMGQSVRALVEFAVAHAPGAVAQSRLRGLRRCMRHEARMHQRRAFQRRRRRLQGREGMRFGGRQEVEPADRPRRIAHHGA
ncbi:hypothetical protein APY03_1692 [Variovorax sp. WDL1]|nr:hypothetical protein APY03_1692 [Variovorax sp. WDL1]